MIIEDLPTCQDEIHGWWYDGKLATAVSADPWNTAVFIRIEGHKPD
jgi:hypothetical protein